MFTELVEDNFNKKAYKIIDTGNTARLPSRRQANSLRKEGHMFTRPITLALTACLIAPQTYTADTYSSQHTRTKQDLQVVAHQFPQLLMNAFVALNHENDQNERDQAFYNAINNIVNIASLVRSAHDITDPEISDILRMLDSIFEEDPYHENVPDTRMTCDTISCEQHVRTLHTRNAHVIAHNFPHLMLNTFIALNHDNDDTERHLAFFNALNNIINIATAIRSTQDLNRENVRTILGILDTALGEDNVELKFYAPEAS